MEEEPGIIVRIEGNEFEATPSNTTLFRFVGSLAMYNHVFLCTDCEAGTGTYLFNQNPAYETFERYMIENEYPLHDNLREVSECDFDAFEKMIKIYVDEIPDGVPADWS